MLLLLLHWLLLLGWILVVKKPPWHSSPDWRVVHGIVSEFVFFLYFQKTWFCLISINALIKIIFLNISKCNLFLNGTTFVNFDHFLKSVNIYNGVLIIKYIFTMLSIVWLGIVILVFFIIYAWPKQSTNIDTPRIWRGTRQR